MLDKGDWIHNDTFHATHDGDGSPVLHWVLCDLCGFESRHTSNMENAKQWLNIHKLRCRL